MFLCTISAIAKDVITKTDGTKIDAKVEEITESIIKYRKATNPTGPVYTLPITSVVNVVYENGETDTFKKGLMTTVADPIQQQVSSDDDLISIAESQEYLFQQGNLSDSQLLQIVDTPVERIKSKASKYRKIGWIGGASLVVIGPIIGYLIDYDGDPTPYVWGGTGIGLALGAGWCVACNLKANSLMKQAKEMQSYSTNILENELIRLGDNSLTAGINVMGNRMVNSHSLGVSIGVKF